MPHGQPSSSTNPLSERIEWLVHMDEVYTAATITSRFCWFGDSARGSAGRVPLAFRELGGNWGVFSYRTLVVCELIFHGWTVTSVYHIHFTPVLGAFPLLRKHGRFSCGACGRPRLMLRRPLSGEKRRSEMGGSIRASRRWGLFGTPGGAILRMPSSFDLPGYASLFGLLSDLLPIFHFAHCSFCGLYHQSSPPARAAGIYQTIIG